MALKTENLAIVLTDIVGYTERTAHQSRRENERLLEQHNAILFPLIKKYKGRLIKSIGDALLMVFRSPTDAMLCAMAMQDALYEYNRKLPEEKQIHIRVAASLGEVRVTRNDIFGEPVNTTSRIEGITPKDEIYLSEAIYMAMNKAEVPCQEVGWRELKGISEPIRIFNIPRFSTPRLIPEDVMASEDIGDLVYPFGGAHLAVAKPSESHFDLSDIIHDKPLMHKLEGAVAAVAIIALALYFFPEMRSRLEGDKAEPVAASPAIAVVDDKGASEEGAAPAVTATPAGVQGETAAVDAAPKTEAVVVTVPEAAPAETAEAKTPPSAPLESAPVVKEAPAVVSKPAVATLTPEPAAKPEVKPAPKPAPKPVAKPAPKPAPKEEPAPVAVVEPPQPKSPVERYPTFSAAKTAYSAGRLDKGQYKELVQELKIRRKAEMEVLEREYDAKIAELKQQYRSGAITKAEYGARVDVEKTQYKQAIRLVDQRYD